MKVKLSDISKEMGISVAAVSMAINNKNGVSDETREQVITVAERLGYKMKKVQPAQSNIKRFIKLLRIKKHGLVVMETAFFADLIEAIEKQCKKMGFELLISNVTLDKTASNQIVEEYREGIDGLIVLCTELDIEDLDGLFEKKFPLVVLDRKFECNVDTILMNNEKASRQAFEFLVDSGHTEIGYLKSSTSIYNFDSRFNSYCESVARNGLILNQEYILSLEPTIEGAYRDMKNLLSTLKQHQLPTAFIADNDIIALGAMNAMKEVGIRIPEDVSIIGIDDMPFCKMVTPQLSTIKVYKEEIGRYAVKMVVEQIEQESEFFKTVLVDTVLINRGSVQKLK